MNIKTKKFISVFLTAAMLFTVPGISAWAEETENVTEITEEAEQTDVQTPDEEPQETKDSTDGVIESEEIITVPEEDYVGEQGEAYDAAVQELSVSLMAEGETTVEGEGTKENPYKIYNEQQFIDFAVGNITDGLKAYWSLEADIELTADTWAPIGAYTPFSGVFYGNGHKISSTKLFQSTAMSGIFGQNAGTIKDLDVNVTIVDVATNTGTLCATNTGRIENCHAEGSITTNENKNIGGLVGYNNGGVIYNCGADVVITAPNSTVGGLVGYNQNATVKNSYASNDDEDSVIAGNVVGGLVGYAYNNNSNIRSLISNCYSLSKIAGGSKTGGLIGQANVYDGRGYIQVEYSYAKGVITKGSSAGGLIGTLNNQEKIPVRYCYYNTINTGNKIGFGMSLLNFTKQESFYDWNFDTVWAMDPDINNGYPYIKLISDEVPVIEGEGTKEKPYIVTNEKQLCYIASEKLPLDAYYKQANDIEITANFWTPIGGDGTGGFSGVYDGDGHKVTGAHLENSFYKYDGLFGKNTGTVKNLTAEGWYTGNENVGVLAGYNSGTIDNCNSYIEDAENKIYGTAKVGGLVGYNDCGKILNSHSSAEVVASGADAGGLVGYSRNGYIKYCYATGDATGKKTGGLVGVVYNNDRNSTSTVSNCYATGRIYGSANAGGLIGSAEIYDSRGKIYVEYSYSRGKIETNSSSGGLVGGWNNRDLSRIRCCYYNNANTGNMIGFGVKVADLKKQDTFYNWDFDNVWKINSRINSGLPYLEVTGERAKTVLKGNGEEDRPYLIYTEQDLLALVDDIYGNYDLSVKHFYKLMNDIELTANFWTPIGANASNDFRGIFDGNGHKISNLKLSNTHYQHAGLFGRITGTVKNLTVEAELDGGEITGAIAGESLGTIENCSSLGTVSTSASSGCAGGIVGCSSTDSVLICSNSFADVSAPHGRSGGITGELANAVMQYCYATGNISGYTVGGAVGRIYNSLRDHISKMLNCYARGKVSGTYYVGGLVGYLELYDSRGYIYVEYCYATGDVGYKGSYGSGLSGGQSNRDKCQVRYSYYNSENKYNKQGFSATLGQMQEKELYYMWNFKNIWAIDKNINDGFPYLNVNGKIKNRTLEGYGDEDDPYLIYDEEDLWTLVDGTYDLSLKSCYQLQNDIEITAEHWTPIGGNGRTVFNGIFDGNGYTISGVKLYNSDYQSQGLFGENSGTIKNVNVIASISGDENVGAICGHNTGIIENCGSAGAISSNLSNGRSGGIVGENINTGVIRGCYSTATISGQYSGGIVGYLYNNNSSTSATVSNCYARGNVYGSESSGGLAGFTNVYDSRGTTHIEYSYSTGKVTGKNIGGLVGKSSSSVKNEILSSYYNTTNTGLTDIDRGTPLEDSVMKVQTSYVGYDFSNVWEMREGENNGYPVLRGIDALPLPIAITGVTLDTAEITLSVGGSALISAIFTPEDATNRELLWSSSNNDVATVSNGKITGRDVGTAEITATTADGGFYAVCVVTVTAAPTVAVTGVTLNKSNMALIVGDTETLTATVAPSDAANKAVSWTSSNTAVAAVSNGTVTAKKAGTAVITVTTSDGGYSAKCSVTVTEKEPEVVAVTGVALNKSAVSLEEGKTETLQATVMPDNATDKAVTWKSSNTAVAAVSNGTVTAKKAGTAVITVTTSDGGYTANCTVTVTAKQVDDKAPKIKISEVKAKPGNEVDVTVELENNIGFASLGIEIGYDSDIMTLTKVTSNSGVGATFTPAQTYTANPFNMGWDSAANVTYNGNLSTLTFKIADNAADGIYPITVDYYKGVNGTYVDGNDVNYNEDLEAVGFVYVNGSVIVASYIPGDINGDEKINNKDATFLLRYLAGWNIDGINTDALDTDGSGTVNNKDATILLRYLAGWAVTLH